MSGRFQFNLKWLLLGAALCAVISWAVAYPMESVDCPKCINGVPNARFYGKDLSGSYGCCYCQARGTISRSQLWRMEEKERKARAP